MAEYPAVIEFHHVRTGRRPAIGARWVSGNTLAAILAALITIEPGIITLDRFAAAIAEQAGGQTFLTDMLIADGDQVVIRPAADIAARHGFGALVTELQI